MRYTGYLMVASILLGGCSALSLDSSPKGLDGVACVGSVPANYPGLVPDTNAELLAEAQEATGEAGVCSGQIFKVVEPIKVYRVYDQDRGASYDGRWWALSVPAGSREQYRKDYAICPEWSDLDALVSCKLTPGAQVVIGVTQSARCQTETYPKTDKLQLYVANNAWTETLFVEDCTDEGEWPR
ncbi:hypothetical protein LX59_00724 [Azomonas agilis]|uniref:Uncharacterized protein n=1 Tax=Azomonas agilis TaxID=116849 RepID=A0A562J073_9GAMM|nr:hypothetical protein [Azomonas agilis]TWH76679.1 hypothetical protein LX59_00724 [Azomonas agilis]